ncbi:hypothetical protein [Halorubrum yunnanense]|uniref:Transposase n=1 Tax=Halorubrum yunnanense TaxID=1526162 RepID=A0ABD5YAF2_9EURY|nr:hypothetical protein [Halorubrum yunnanense]
MFDPQYGFADPLLTRYERNVRHDLPWREPTSKRLRNRLSALHGLDELRFRDRVLIGTRVDVIVRRVSPGSKHRRLGERDCRRPVCLYYDKLTGIVHWVLPVNLKDGYSRLS